MLRNQLFQKSHIVSKVKFKEVDTSNCFFDIFRQSYGKYYEKWLVKKKEDDVYVAMENGNLIGFLKIKIEDESEDYSDMQLVRSFRPMLRLKISSMRTEPEYPGLGSQLMMIVFTEAHKYDVKEIYGTVPVSLPEKERVYKFLTKWGFKNRGYKRSNGVWEEVYVRPFSREGVIGHFFELH